MILLVADSKHCVTRSAFSGKRDRVQFLQVNDRSFPSNLASALKQDDLELAVIECHINENTCLPLINDIKKRRTDVPVLFIMSSDTDHAIAEAFKRGARDCFRNPFDLKTFQEQVRKVLEFRRTRREQRLPLNLSVDRRNNGHQYMSDLPEGIVRVVHFLEDRTYTGDISLARLASIAGMSPYHFCRTFKRTIGRSPIQYVLQLRIEHAMKLLKNHSRNMSVSQIASSVGFYDSSSLNRHFKKTTGLTPTEFIHTVDRSD